VTHAIDSVMCAFVLFLLILVNRALPMDDSLLEALARRQSLRYD
jgi:hypothetical protein